MVNAKKPLSIVLALLIALSALCAITAGTAVSASAASGDTIYFAKPDSWNQVCCYVWGGNSGEAKGWPGTAMTAVEGNVYSFTMPGDQNMVIFNNGNNGAQTKDLTYAGAGKLFTPAGDSGNGIDGSWTDYGDVTPTDPSNPTDATDPTDSTNPTDPSGDVAYAYLNNAAGWSSPTVYYWKNGSLSNAGWPGTALSESSKNSEGYYEVVIPAEYIDKTNGGVIFSNNGSDKSDDLKIGAGESKVYNNSTKTWEDYDSGPLKFTSFGTNEESPQYKDTDVTIFASAVSETGGAVQYQYSISGAETKVLKAYSDATSVVWTPTVAGTYKITVDIKDANGNTNSRSIDYVIKDDATEAKPILKSITPSTGSLVKTNEKTNVTVNATGGQVGTNLLFYKVAITQQSTGKVVNGDVYYSLNKTYSFTPTEDGIYNVTVSVQNSNNTTVIKQYELTATSNDTDLYLQSFTASSTGTVAEGTTVDYTALAAGGSQPYSYQFYVDGTLLQNSSAQTFSFTPSAAGTYTVTVTVKDAEGATATQSLTLTVTGEEYAPGDINLDGVVNLKDAIVAQKVVLKMITLTSQQISIGDLDGDGDVKLYDAIMIQKKALNIG